MSDDTHHPEIEVFSLSFSNWATLLMVAGFLVFISFMTFGVVVAGLVFLGVVALVSYARLPREDRSSCAGE